MGEQEIHISALSIRSTGGSGYGVDLGVAARPLPFPTAGLTVENVVQRMTWSEDLEIRGDVFAGSEFADLGAGDIYDRLESRPFDPDSAPLEAYALAGDLLEQAYFPRVVRAGAGPDLGSTKLGATIGATRGFDPHRFAERIAAGSGYGFSFGMSLRGF